MRGHETAFWAGIASFFGSLLAIGTIDILNPDKAVQYLTAFFVAIITGASVYAKQRLEDAKQEKNPPTTYKNPEE